MSPSISLLLQPAFALPCSLPLLSPTQSLGMNQIAQIYCAAGRKMLQTTTVFSPTSAIYLPPPCLREGLPALGQENKAQASFCILANFLTRIHHYSGSALLLIQHFQSFCGFDSSIVLGKRVSYCLPFKNGQIEQLCNTNPNTIARTIQINHHQSTSMI
jgi:hypothetical protein